MTGPRGINDRIEWFLDNNPSDRGMCAQHSWHSLGGDYGNPPAWGASDANAAVDKVKNSGRYWTPKTWHGDPPVGAWVGYKYGNNGHAAIRHHNTSKIATTDPSNSNLMVGIEGLNYPNKWGASGYTVWTDTYNSVRFPIGKTTLYLSKLVYGQKDSDSVRRLQGRLNQIKLEGGEELPLSGNFLDGTMDELSKWQEQKATDKTTTDGSWVTDAQAYELFEEAIYEVVDDTPDEEVPDQPPLEEEEVITGFNLWKWYSGKPSGTYTLNPDGEWHSLKFVQPHSGISEESSELHFIYLRCELDKTRSAEKVMEVKFVRSNGDDTAYDHVTFGLTKNSYPFPSIHFESGSGIGGEWWAKVTGGTSPIKITTRYAKTHVLAENPQEV